MENRDKGDYWGMVAKTANKWKLEIQPRLNLPALTHMHTSAYTTQSLTNINTTQTQKCLKKIDWNKPDLLIIQMKQVFSICFEMHILIVQQNIKRAFIGIFNKY